jgi:hypothetical protein
MDESSEPTGKSAWGTLLSALRPAVPAVIGASALTFLFAALMPMTWVIGISWNLYLDRLSDLFVPPVGNGGRLALALGMAAIAAIIAGLVALVIAQPEAVGMRTLRRPMPRQVDDEDGDAILQRRRADLHPDDLPRPPIRAGRDLPAEGLMAQAAPLHSGPEEEDELILADLAPDDMPLAGAEPWLQPVEKTGPPMPDPADHSLGAMVARLEAGLARRGRGQAAPQTAAVPVPMPDVADGEPEIDFALEAALSTLQRMTRQAVG